MWWGSSSGRIELQITKRQAQVCSHSGPCDADVLELSKVPSIVQQVSKIHPDTLRAELKEYGAWDDVELTDHAQNIQRLLWIAANDIADTK